MPRAYAAALLALCLLLAAIGLYGYHALHAIFVRIP